MNPLAIGATEVTYRKQYPLQGIGICGSGDPVQQASAAKWVRLDLNWKIVERSAGVFDFSKYQAIQKSYLAAGMRICWVLGYGNPVYSGSADETVAPTTQPQLDAWGKFCAAAARALGGHGELWELWNEPNITQFSKPSSSVLYSQILQKAISGIRSVSSVYWIAFGAISEPQEIERFLRPILDAPTVWKGADAISIHTYAIVPEDIGKYLQNMPLPVVNTEVGWSQKRMDAVLGPSIEDWEVRQSETVLRSLRANVAAGILLNIVFNWMDSEYGALRMDGSPRPLLKMLCNQNTPPK